MNNRAAAKSLLVHYIRTCWPDERYNWDYDNIGEVESIVDLIIEAVIERLEEKEGQC